MDEVFKKMAKTFVVTDADKEVPARRTSGLFVTRAKFSIGTSAQREHLKHTNTPPLPRESSPPSVWSYDSFCSFVVNMVKRAQELFSGGGMAA
ncbi:hypothetical protein C8R43DRAFT_1143391 [Mycena crocata]|nr:hypothetical protein C8R43DRAFT_1143391 [Mycena crocata]